MGQIFTKQKLQKAETQGQSFRTQNLRGKAEAVTLTEDKASGGEDSGVKLKDVEPQGAKGYFKYVISPKLSFSCHFIILFLFLVI